MKLLLQKLISDKSKTMPILSFPSTQLMGITVKELLASSDRQAEGMKTIMDRCALSASLNMMDLSVEAEAFGAIVHFSDCEIPTVTKGAIDSIDGADSLRVPSVGEKRTGIYVDGVRKAKKLMPDKLIFCGAIGPYSLAGRLYDMTELMINCYDEPEKVEVLLEKATEFSINYIKEFKKAGADGVVLAEPAAGLLSPDLCKEFSDKYVKKIISEVKDENFVFVYHNCGNTIPLAEGLAQLGADVYHFGNAINLSEMLSVFPRNLMVMGNVNPVNFRNETPERLYAETMEILQKCSGYDNFVVSSGCDIPADSKWENIDAYFKAVKDFYGR